MLESKCVINNLSRGLSAGKGALDGNVMAVGSTWCVCSVFPSECSGQLHTLWSAVLDFSCDCTGKWDLEFRALPTSVSVHK